MKETDRPAVLLVDKPVGPTSHDVVALVRRSLGLRRIGHTGTLDPFASGLLILCVGWATRLAEYFHLLPKAYEATATLGAETDTGDLTGAVKSRSESWQMLEPEAIRRAADGLRGEQEQVPPSYSALKVGGRRAYEAARAGERVELPARSVTVHSLDVTSVRLPEVDLVTEVSTGTYVRALARDLGRELGCGAHLKALRRVAIGPFRVANAARAEDLESGSIPAAACLTASRALSWLPARSLSPVERADVEHGRPIRDTATGDDSDLPVAMVVAARLVAVGRRDGEFLRPEKVFHG